MIYLRTFNSASQKRSKRFLNKNDQQLPRHRRRPMMCKYEFLINGLIYNETDVLSLRRRLCKFEFAKLLDFQEIFRLHHSKESPQCIGMRASAM